MKIKGKAINNEFTADLNEKIYNQITGKETPGVLREVSELLSVKDVAIYSAPPHHRRFTSVVSGHIEHEIHKAYLDYYQMFDTQIRRLLSFNNSEFLTGTDLATSKEINNCPVHNEYLVPNRIDTQLVYFLPGDQGHKRTFVAMRNKQQGQFNTNEIALFKKVALSFRRSFDLNDLKQQIRSLNQISDTVHQEMKIGVAALNDVGQIIYINQILKNFMQRSNLLLIRDNKFKVTCHQKVPLQKLLNNAIAGKSDSQFVSHENLRINIKVLPYSDALLNVISTSALCEARVLIVLQELSEHKKFDPRLIQDYLDITAAESRLAAHLANGGTTTDYITKTGLSIHTARNQLKSIFSKTGICKQKDLVVKIFETKPN